MPTRAAAGVVAKVLSFGPGVCSAFCDTECARIVRSLLAEALVLGAAGARSRDLSPSRYTDQRGGRDRKLGPPAGDSTQFRDNHIFLRSVQARPVG